MIVGFDYWQVISHWPKEFGVLASALDSYTGNEVHVISAIGKNRIGTIAADVHGHWPYFPADHIHEVVFERSWQSPQLKLAKCQELGIQMFFDDRDDVCRLLNENGIIAMRVTRKDGSKYDLSAERPASEPPIVPQASSSGPSLTEEEK